MAVLTDKNQSESINLPDTFNIFTDHYLINEPYMSPLEIRLAHMRNKLIAKNYTQEGILKGTFKSNLEKIQNDFESYNSYFSLLLFERNPSWSYINPLGTISFFLDENELPGFQEMPQKSISSLKKKLQEDLDNDTLPNIIEIGRFATNTTHNKLSYVKNLMGCGHDIISTMTMMPFYPSTKTKTHAIACTNSRHANFYKKCGFTVLSEETSSVYNNKEGVFSFVNLYDLLDGNKGKEFKRKQTYEFDLI